MGVEKSITKLIKHSKIKFRIYDNRYMTCSCKLATGYIIDSSTCNLNKSNFNVKDAKKKCMVRIKEKLRRLESYRLSALSYEMSQINKMSKAIINNRVTGPDYK